MSFDNFTPNPKPTKSKRKAKKPLTEKEIKYILKVKALGCIVMVVAARIKDYCEGGIEFHHATECGRRLGHDKGMGLCRKHHQYGKISVGKSKKEFHEKYGSQQYLLDKVKMLLRQGK
jgi:hypothetical protein